MAKDLPLPPLRLPERNRASMASKFGSEGDRKDQPRRPTGFLRMKNRSHNQAKTTREGWDG